jgi:hypothetical protein
MADGQQPADRNLVQCEITMSRVYLRALCCGGPKALTDRHTQRALHDRLAGTRVIALG